MEKCKYGCKNGKVFIEATSTWQPCPQCGATPLNEMTRKVNNVLENQLLECNIPEIYQSLTLQDFTKLFQHPTLLKGYDYANTKDVLQNILLGVEKEEKQTKSYYIHLPFFMESEIYAYILQKVALTNRLTVSPYITLNNLNGLIRGSDYGITSMKGVTLTEYNNPEILDAIDGCKLANELKVTYADFIQADVCVLHASANTSQRGFNALADILAERSRRGRATIVIGYWNHTNKNASALNYLKVSDTTFNKLGKLEIIEPTKIAEKTGTKKPVNQLKNFTI